MPGSTFFISYSNTDEATVARLRDDLRRAGAVIWIDHEQLTPGTPDWEEAVRTGIAQADAVVYVASPDARRSRYVRDELSVASDAQKPVYPFWAAGEKWHDCAPLGWGSTQYADGRGTRYAEGLQKLLNALGLAADTSPAVAPPAAPSQHTSESAASAIRPPSGILRSAAPSQASAVTPVHARQKRHPFVWLARSWRLYRRRFVAILAAVLVVVVAATGLLSEQAIASIRAANAVQTQTVNAKASATAAAWNTAWASGESTVSAIATPSTMRFPYVAPAPGPQCDTGAPWQPDFDPAYAPAISCASNPTRSVLTCSSSQTCFGAYTLTTGRYFTLSSSYTISVEVSVIGSGGAGGAVGSVGLYLGSSGTPSSPGFTYYEIYLYTDGSYTMCHGSSNTCPQLGQGSWNTRTKTPVALRVSSSDVSGSVNGTVVATVPDALMATQATNSTTSLKLLFTVPPAFQADFANFQITQP